jgi:hypothetical protein
MDVRLAQVKKDQERRDYPHRHVDKEDPPPVGELHDSPTNQRPGHARYTPYGPENSLQLRSFFNVEQVADDGEGNR